MAILNRFFLVFLSLVLFGCAPRVIQQDGWGGGFSKNTASEDFARQNQPEEKIKLQPTFTSLPKVIVAGGYIDSPKISKGLSFGQLEKGVNWALQ